MNILKAHLRSVAEFLDRYLPDLPTGGLFIPTRKSMTIGEPVVVSLRLGPRGTTVLMRGTVAWRRPGKHRTKTQAGIGIEFLESEEKTRDYLLSVARGDQIAISARRHQRLPLDLPVLWQVPGARQENMGVLRDIGRGGAFVMTEQSLDGETDVVLMMAPPGAEVAMPVSARIAWVAPGQSPEPGFGVAWKARDAGGGRRIKELVRRMERLGRVEPSAPAQ
ncbi:MAG: PilZ domain-containing protein [Deltaproteobacteria bacterium]|nr:PilZ domain-containing protein [Deltaproteobacteria bacterium]